MAGIFTSQACAHGSRVGSSYYTSNFCRIRENFPDYSTGGRVPLARYAPVGPSK